MGTGRQGGVETGGLGAGESSGVLWLTAGGGEGGRGRGMAGSEGKVSLYS